MTILLAQGKPLPQPNQGPRVIIDQTVPPPVLDKSPNVVTSSTYYWIGAVVLLAVAALGIYSVFGGSNSIKK